MTSALVVRSSRIARVLFAVVVTLVIASGPAFDAVATGAAIASGCLPEGQH